MKLVHTSHATGYAITSTTNTTAGAINPYATHSSRLRAALTAGRARSATTDECVASAPDVAMNASESNKPPHDHHNSPVPHHTGILRDWIFSGVHRFTAARSPATIPKHTDAH